MIIELKIRNFRSIRDTQTLSMVASSGTELTQNIFPADFDVDLKLVRSAVIYGQNAGGKSNLIRALYFMHWLVLTSAKESQYGEKIPVESFLFDEESREQPSEFEIIFSKEGIRYQYGFILNENRIFEEWLFAYPSGRAQKWFSRKYNDKKYINKIDKHDYEWEFSKFFKGKKQSWVSPTRSNALFLSTAVQLNNEQLIPIFSWFQKDLVVIPHSKELDFNKTIEQIKTSEGKQQIMKYMDVADPSIVDILLDIEKFPENKLPKAMPQEIKDILKKSMAGKDMAKISLVHAGKANLPVQEESDGTRRLLALAGYWIDILGTGKVIFIDELNSSLHPLAAKFLVDLICNSELNKKNAQLIFSTHDTSLLDADLFRRDQIWFVEKDKNNSTQLYPLLNFSPRKHEALGKGYLLGRYGALPYIGNWSF